MGLVCMNRWMIGLCKVLRGTVMVLESTVSAVHLPFIICGHNLSIRATHLLNNWITSHFCDLEKWGCCLVQWLGKWAWLALCLWAPAKNDAFLDLPHAWKRTRTRWPQRAEQDLAAGVITHLGLISALCDITKDSWTFLISGSSGNTETEETVRKTLLKWIFCNEALWRMWCHKKINTGHLKPQHFLPIL